MKTKPEPVLNKATRDAAACSCALRMLFTKDKIFPLLTVTWRMCSFLQQFIRRLQPRADTPLAERCSKERLWLNSVTNSTMQTSTSSRWHSLHGARECSAIKLNPKVHRRVYRTASFFFFFNAETLFLHEPFHLPTCKSFNCYRPVFFSSRILQLTSHFSVLCPFHPPWFYHCDTTWWRVKSSNYETPQYTVFLRPPLRLGSKLYVALCLQTSTVCVLC
jgi:hypothetical protein